MILSKFKWGPAFYSLNAHRLENYYLNNCQTHESLQLAEQQFLKDMEGDRERLKEEREECHGQVVFTSSSEDEDEKAYY